MWADCLNNLSPFPRELKTGVPIFIKKAFNREGIFNEDEMFIPVHPVSLLGQCRTGAYAECPNMPEHHIENSQCDDDPNSYLNTVGEYHWFDFDIVYPNREPLQLRLVVNTGDGDCNDGLWGAVWEPNTEEFIANILSTGDSEATVQATSRKYVDLYENESVWFPSRFAEREDDPIPCMTMEYADDLVLEKIIGLAIRICFVYGHRWFYTSHGTLNREM
jgi:hypothetical protein